MMYRQDQRGVALLLEIILVAVVLGVVGAAIIASQQARRTADTNQPQASPSSASSPKSMAPNPQEKFIMANFVDLSQYMMISKFRSCEGHDFSGLNISGQTETNRSMKHYLEAKPAFMGSVGKLAVFAPFDGKVVMLEKDNRGSRIGLGSDKHPGWQLTFFHTDLAGGLAVGSSVKQGQMVGYGNLSGGGGNFDVGLKWTPGGNSQEERLDSPMLHLSEAVAADYQKHGLSPDVLVTSKAVRDSAPCQRFGRADSNWVEVR
jgi:hypothetical protein